MSERQPSQPYEHCNVLTYQVVSENTIKETIPLHVHDKDMNHQYSVKRACLLTHTESETPDY